MIVAYWESGRLVERSGADLPTDKVLWVDLGHRRLQGMDNYWVDGEVYGMFNDPENAEVYEGYQSVAWVYEGGAERQDRRLRPGPEAVIFRGVQLSDRNARKVGLL